jgi:hypothetical protein
LLGIQEGGSAIPGTDYTAASGITHFAALQTSAALEVPILDNQVIDRERTVRIQLHLDRQGGTSLPPTEFEIVNNDLGLILESLQRFQSPGFRIFATGIQESVPQIEFSRDLSEWEPLENLPTWGEFIETNVYLEPARFFRVKSSR